MDFFEAFDDLEADAKSRRTLKNASNDLSITPKANNGSLETTSQQSQEQPSFGDSSVMNFKDFTIFGSKMNMNFFDDEESENDNEENANIATDFSHIDLLGGSSTLLNSVLNRINGKKQPPVEEEPTPTQINQQAAEESDQDDNQDNDDIDPTQPEINLDSEGLFDSMGGLSQVVHTDDFAKEKPTPKFNISKTIIEEEEEEDQEQLENDSHVAQINTDNAYPGKSLPETQDVTQKLTGTLAVSLTSTLPQTEFFENEEDDDESDKEDEDDKIVLPHKTSASTSKDIDDDDEDEMTKHATKHNNTFAVEEEEEDDDIVQKTRVHNPLFVEESDESDANDSSDPGDVSDADNNHPTFNVDAIEGYKAMSREEKVQARIAEKQRLRDLEEQQKKDKAESDAQLDDDEFDDNYGSDNDYESNRKLSKKQLLAQEMMETVEANELKKKDYHFMKKVNKEKFQTSNIDNFFDDSDDDDEKLFSGAVDVEDSPLSSPVKNTVSTGKPEKSNKDILLSGPLKKYAESAIKIRNNIEKVVILEDDSSDSDNENLKISKAKKFDLQRKFGAKNQKVRQSEVQSRKSGIVASDSALFTSNISVKDLKATVKHRLIVQHSEMARSKLSQKKNAESIRKEELDVIKLLQEERKRNNMIREKEKEIAKARRMAKSQKLDDEMGESSDGESSEGEFDSEEEEEIQQQETANIQDTEDIQIEQEEVSYDLGEGDAGNVFNAMSLSDAFGLTLPANKSFDGLQGAEVAQKLKEIEGKKGLVDVSMAINESDIEEDSFTQNSHNGDSSNILSKLSFFAAHDEDDDMGNDADVEEGVNRTDPVTQRHHRLLDSQNFLPDTQADIQTQTISRSNSLTQNDANDDKQDDEDEDEDEVIKNPARKRRSIKPMKSIEEEEARKQASSSDEEVYADENDDEEEEEEEESEESKRMRIQLIKEFRKKEEAARRKREKEKRSKGLNTIMDQEAVESEDEWQGLGGRDGEGSDQMDSEDEKMLDDGSLINVDEDQIRKYLNEEDIELDDKMVKKIMYDWKAGNFRNRRAKDGAYELDSSDDEGLDYLRRLAERSRRQKEAEEARYAQLNSKDKKSLPFFKAMHESTTSFKLDNNDDEDTPDSIVGLDLEVGQKKDLDEKENDDPFRVAKRPREDDGVEGGEIVFEAPGSISHTPVPALVKKKARLTAESVRKALSFLNETDGSPSKAYDGFSFNDYDQDGSEAIKQLKQNSIVRSSISSTSSTVSIGRGVSTSTHRALVPKKHNHKSKTSFETIISDEETESNVEAQVVEEIIDDNNEDELDMGLGIGILASRSKSITSSFKKFNAAKLKEVRTGVASGSSRKAVNVTTSTKPVFGSRSSVTYLTKGLPPSIAMGTKNSVIQESLKLSHKGKRLGLHKKSSFN